MVDPTTPPPAATPSQAPSQAPATAPAATPATAPTTPSTPPETTSEVGVKAGTAGNKSIARGGAGLITNPTPVADPDAPAPAEKLPDSVPQSTIDEMNAGAEALKRNKPVATALEQARKDKDAEASSSKA